MQFSPPYMWLSYWYTGIDAPILVPKKGIYTFLYNDIFFFRLFPEFKIKKNLFSSKTIYLSYFKRKKILDMSLIRVFQITLSGCWKGRGEVGGGIENPPSVGGMGNFTRAGCFFRWWASEEDYIWPFKSFSK